jgi:malonate transporter
VNFAQLLLPDFSLILCGYLVCRYTALNRTTWEQVESLVYFFLFPVLLFQSIVRSPLDLGAASSLIAAGLLLGVAASPGLQPALVAGAAPHIDRASTPARRRSPSASTPSSRWRWPSACWARRACC